MEDHSQVPGPAECQTDPYGIDSLMQKGSSRRDPEMEGLSVCRRPSPGAWGHLLDNVRPSGLMDDCSVCVHTGPIIGMAHAVH